MLHESFARLSCIQFENTLRGEVAHAVILCPSFYRAEIVQNPNAWDRFIARLRAGIIGWLQPA